MLDIQKIKADFPIFAHHPELVYLDNAATSHKPQAVLDTLLNFYSSDNSNVHRGIYELSERASQAYEAARARVAEFIGAATSQEIVFTKGTTDSLNLIAQSYALSKLQKGDEVLVTDFEHHSNLLPWRVVCQQTGALLKVLHSQTDGQISQSEWQNQLSSKTKIVAIAHASNVLGMINDIKQIAKLTHQAGALLVVDGAQAVPHLAVNVQDLDCDFYVFSGHKMLGPMGIGVLYAKQDILEEMPPYQVGGGMIESVTSEEVIYDVVPNKFEAGTPNVAGAIALASAMDYLREIGMDEIRAHEISLSKHLLTGLSSIKSVKLLGDAVAVQRSGLVSFFVDGVHAHDLSDYLAKQQIALRAGFHCAMPLHQDRACPATLRASYYLYNQLSDIDSLLVNLQKAIAYYG